MLLWRTSTMHKETQRRRSATLTRRTSKMLYKSTQLPQKSTRSCMKSEVQRLRGDQVTADKLERCGKLLLKLLAAHDLRSLGNLS